MRQTKTLNRSSFHKFSQLPPEIRRHIWSQTLSARIIDVFAFSKKLARDEVGNQAKDDRVYITQKGIPILYVCRESRNVALGIYKHGVDTEDQTSPRFQQRLEELPDEVLDSWKGCHLPCRKTCQRVPGEIRPRLYFDLEKDVICLNKAWWFIGRHPLYPLRNYFGPEVLTNTRYLCLSYAMLAWAAENDLIAKSGSSSQAVSNAAFPRLTLRDFPNLREILVNVDPAEDLDPLYDPDKVSQHAIYRALQRIAFTTPNWKMPMFRLVRDRASLGRVVDLDILTKE
jgi:hypothetical protein